MVNVYKNMGLLNKRTMTVLRNLIVLGTGMSYGVKQKMPFVPPRKLVVSPIGLRQTEYCSLLSDLSIPVLAGIGPAGCGKTFFACNHAANALASGSVERIVITRPIVAVDEELGFLPGSISQKMDPWIRPILDSFGEFYSPTAIQRLMNDRVIEIAPLAYMRGRTFKKTFIIADEMQNSTPNQMLMMLTRIGEGSKLVITGDLMQSDIRSGINGLSDFHQKYKRTNGMLPDIRCVEFEVEDVQRSPVVSSILTMYSNENHFS
jgi:phosphate starvation-inducible PhoH-like protein